MADCTCKGARVVPDGIGTKLIPNEPEHICAVHGPQTIIYSNDVPAGFGYEPAAPGEFDLHKGTPAFGITHRIESAPPHVEPIPDSVSKENEESLFERFEAWMRKKGLIGGPT
jgi:hypothetical protein